MFSIENLEVLGILQDIRSSEGEMLCFLLVHAAVFPHVFTVGRDRCMSGTLGFFGTDVSSDQAESGLMSPQQHRGSVSPYQQSITSR